MANITIELRLNLTFDGSEELTEKDIETIADNILSALSYQVENTYEGLAPNDDLLTDVIEVQNEDETTLAIHNYLWMPFVEE